MRVGHPLRILPYSSETTRKSPRPRTVKSKRVTSRPCSSVFHLYGNALTTPPRYSGRSIIPPQIHRQDCLCAIHYAVKISRTPNLFAILPNYPEKNQPSRNHFSSGNDRQDAPCFTTTRQFAVPARQEPRPYCRASSGSGSGRPDGRTVIVGSHQPAYFFPMRYRCVFVRRYSESSATAGLAMNPSLVSAPSRFSATKLNLLPVPSTNVLPIWLQQ